MTDSIRSISAQGAVLKPATVERASAPASADVAFSVRGDKSNFSQRFVVDPQAGMITEYLTSKGDVRAQIPSSIVVAYLRAGLTADGLSREQAEAQAHTKSTTSV